MTFLAASWNKSRGRISEDAADEVAFTLADPLAFTTNPEMRPILEEACWFCWEAYRKDYSPSPNRRQFLREYCAGRFVTVALLDAAWEECKRVEKDYARSALLNPLNKEAVEGTEDGKIHEARSAENREQVEYYFTNYRNA